MALRLVVALMVVSHVSLHVVGGPQEDEGYGVDVSFPIHHHWTDSSTPLNEERKHIYEDFMDGCRKTFGKKGDRCDQTEQDRIEMSLRQPQSMKNYTSTGT